MIQIAPEQENFLDQMSEMISQQGFRVPALVILEAGRPLTFLGGQLLWLLQPALSLLLPTQKISQAAQLLENPEMVNELIVRLEKDIP